KTYCDLDCRRVLASHRHNMPAICLGLALLIEGGNLPSSAPKDIRLYAWITASREGRPTRSTARSLPLTGMQKLPQITIRFYRVCGKLSRVVCKCPSRGRIPLRR